MKLRSYRLTVTSHSFLVGEVGINAIWLPISAILHGLWLSVQLNLIQELCAKYSGFRRRKQTPNTSVVHRLSASPATFRIWNSSFHLKDRDFQEGCIREPHYLPWRAFSMSLPLTEAPHHQPSFCRTLSTFQELHHFPEEKTHRQNRVNLSAVCTIHNQETEKHLKLILYW